MARLGLYRAHHLEMHLENSSMDSTRDDFYLVRTLVHISHGSCTEHDTHTQGSASLSVGLGLTYSPCFPSPALGL